MTLRPFAIAAVAGLALVCGWAAMRRAPAPYLRAAISPAQVWADGYDAAALTIDAPATARPHVSLLGNSHIATAGQPEWHGGHWVAEMHAGVLPGTVTVRVETPGAQPVKLPLTAALAERDSREDGTPDFLRLDSNAARAAFRRWFTYLAEAQYFQGRPEARPAEIDDCAALDPLYAYFGNRCARTITSGPPAHGCR